MIQTDNTPETTGFMRLPQVLEVIPVSKSTWWAGIKTGRFPKPYRLGPGITVWRREDILQFVNRVEINKSN